MAPRENDATYREIFETDPRPMWIRDAELPVFLAVNGAALALYGYGREEFLKLSPAELIVSDGRHRSRDGSLLPVEVTERSVTFEGKPARVALVEVGGGEEELRRHLAEKATQLEAAQKELETFSYSVSHDLRAPLRHIDGFSKAILDDHGEALAPQAKEYLERIGRSARKMSELIDDLQKLGRVARQEMVRQEVNLSVLAQVISLEMKHAEPQRRVEFVIPEGIKANCDQKLVRVLMEALFGNAWKFSSKNESSRIEFGTLEAEETAYFVRDNGVGFDMAYMEKLFGVFQRLHRADEFEGAGVGLAIARRVVHRHGGRIWAEGEVGRGATFYFTLQGDQ